MDDKNRLKELIEEATIDCYGEDEQFSGILYALDEELNFPLMAMLIGEAVELIGLDGKSSSPHRGVVAHVRHKGQEYSVSLADLKTPDADSHSAEWLAAYQYWLQRY